jgi:broad specificity phosphatase PhoE
MGTNPCLSRAGTQQAENVAARLAGRAPMTILTSPLACARQSAAPLARAWRVAPVVEGALTKMPEPHTGNRTHWLNGFMKSSWRDASDKLLFWRDSVIAVLAAHKEDAVIFTHFFTINAAVGAAMRDDRVALFHPDYGSVTLLDATDGQLSVIEREWRDSVS